MLHCRGEAAADGFDLGEFGHSRFTMGAKRRAATIAPAGAAGYGLPGRRKPATAWRVEP
jgi:hypothetical protein